MSHSYFLLRLEFLYGSPKVFFQVEYIIVIQINILTCTYVAYIERVHFLVIVF